MPDILLKRQCLETPNDSKGHPTEIKENHKIKTRQIKNEENKEQGINGNKGQEKKQMIMNKKNKVS